MIAEQISQEINEKLNKNAYTVSWTLKEYQENKDKHRSESKKLRDHFKADLKNYMFAILGKGVTDEQFEAAYTYAYELGHSSGFNEVWLHYFEVVELLSKFVKGRTI